MSDATEVFQGTPTKDFEDAIVDCLRATTTNRDGTISPDFRTRLAAAQLGMFYKIGKPAEKAETPPPAKSIDEEFADLKERAAHSPALRNLLRELGSLADG
jgi:hypothetical protein